MRCSSASQRGWDINTVGQFLSQIVRHTHAGLQSSLSPCCRCGYWSILLLERQLLNVNQSSAFDTLKDSHDGQDRISASPVAPSPRSLWYSLLLGYLYKLANHPLDCHFLIVQHIPSIRFPALINKNVSEQAISSRAKSVCPGSL